MKRRRTIVPEIDLNPLFKADAQNEDRSNMNATFTLGEKNLKPYLMGCAGGRIIAILNDILVGANRPLCTIPFL